MKGTQFYKIVIVLLIIINAGTIAFMWFGRPPHPPQPGEHPIAEKLELTGEALRKVNALEADHHKTKRALMELEHVLHTKLFNAVGRDTSIDELYENISKNRAEIEKMTFNFFDEISHYCTEAQKVELRKFVQRRLNRLRPGPPPTRNQRP